MLDLLKDNSKIYFCQYHFTACICWKMLFISSCSLSLWDYHSINHVSTASFTLILYLSLLWSKSHFSVFLFVEEETNIIFSSFFKKGVKEASCSVMHKLLSSFMVCILESSNPRDRFLLWDENNSRKLQLKLSLTSLV